MPNGDIDRIRDDIDSLRTSVDSLLKSVNSNMTEILQRLTSIERWEESHERLDSYQHEAAIRDRAELKETASKTAAQIEDLNSERQRIKGFLWAWKAAIGLIGATQAWQLFFGKKL